MSLPYDVRRCAGVQYDGEWREEIVIVRDVETGEQREWIVRGEAMPYYTAQPGESATIRAQVAPGRWEDVPRRSEANK